MTTVDQATDKPPGPSLFAWQRHLAVAIGRGLVPHRAGTVALLMACSGRNGSGDGCTVDATKWAEELDWSGRTIWRWRTWLIEAGWFVQTTTSTRGVKGARGRRARYRIAVPESLATAEPSGDTRSDESCDTEAANDVSRFDESSDIDAASSGNRSTESPDSSGANHLTVETESPDTATADGGTPPSSVGTSSVGDISGDFEALWAMWPKNQERDDAEREYRKARMAGVAPERIRASAAAYIAQFVGSVHVEARNDIRFCMYLRNWLKKKSYENAAPPGSRHRMTIAGGPVTANAPTYDGFQDIDGNALTPEEAFR